MPDGFHIATAWVDVKPDLDGFAAELKAKLDAVTSGDNANARVGVNQGYLDAGLAIAKAKLDAFAATARNINVGLGAGGVAGLAGVDATLKLIQRDVANMATAMAGAAQAAAREGAAAGEAAKGNDENTGAMTRETAAARTLEDAMNDAAASFQRWSQYRRDVVGTAAETTTALSQQAAAARIASYADYQGVASTAAAMRSNIDRAASEESVAAAVERAREKILSYTGTNYLGAAAATKAAIAESDLAAALSAAGAAADDAGPRFSAFSAILARIAGAGGGAGGGGGGGGRGGFGGPFWWLRGTIGGIAAWHVVLDGAVEALIAVGSAAAAAAVGIAAMAPAAGNIHDYLTSIQTVNKALGDQIPGLSTKFDQLARAMAPQVIEAYGGALSLVSHSTGGLAQVAHQVVDLFDTWIAKIDLWAKNSGLMNKLLEDGVIFLGQFGSIFGHLGDALKNFVGDMPGIAHILLDVVDAVATAVDWFSKLPAPLVTATLALHGAYVWGKVLGSILQWAGRQAVGFARSMAALAANPLTWVAAAAAAFGYMAYEGTKADSATQGLISSMETKLSTENASQAILQLAGDIGTLQQRISGLNVKSITEQFTHASGFTESMQQMGFGLDAIWGRLANSVSAFEHGNPLGGLKDQFMALWDVIGGNGDAARVQMSRDMAAMNAEINKMLGSSRELFGETGKLMQQGYSYAQALGIMDLAGVRWNDSAAVMEQKVTNLIDGYKAMSIQGGLLANSVNAITFATLQQDSKVTQLTQAWSAFFSTLTGGETGFVGFAQQAEGLFQAMTAGAPKVSESNGKISTSISGLTGAAANAKGTLTGLNSTSLNLRSTFLQSAQSAQSEMNNLTMLASAAGLGAKGTAMLTQASKDMVASLLPAAKGSAALTTVLYGLAQQGGYKGADSFRELAKWADNAHHPLKNLDDIVTTLTVDAGNLQTDVKNLSVALGQTLTSAMSKAIFFADGGQTAFNNYATALKNTGTQSTQTYGAAKTLGTELVTLTGNTTSAHREFDTMTIALGGTKGEADTLWNEIVGKLDPGIKGIPNKQVTITMTGHGSYSISSQGPSLGLPNTTNSPPLTHRSGGGAIYGPGTSTSDSIPAYLSDGEYVIRADAVSRYGQGFFDALNAGMYASGGPVLGGNTSVLSGQYANTIVSAFQDAMVKSMVDAMKSSINSAKSMSFPGGGASGPGAAAAQAYARSIMPLYGWGAGQFPPLQALWNRESGWNYRATNPSSGAYGIPQSLPASKMAAAGPDWLTNPATQIRWGLGYIKGRYGSPSGAWAHETSAGWYARGGPVRRASGGPASSPRAGEFCTAAEHGKTRNGLVCQRINGTWRWDHPGAGSTGGGGHHGGGHHHHAHKLEHGRGESLDTFYTTASSITSPGSVRHEERKFLKDIADYYTGPARRWRDRMVIQQTRHLENVDSKLSKLNATIQAAKSFQSGIQSGLASYAGLSGLDSFGNLMVPGVKPGQSVGQGLEGQLKLKLSNLRKWQSDIKAMQRAKVSPALISQVAQMDPETGMQYAEAILAGGHSLIREMNATEASVLAVEKSTAKSATRAVYGKSLSAMWEDEHELKKAARIFGEELAKEAAKWFRVPRKQQPPAVLHFHGAHPTAEEKHTLMRELALVLG